MKRAAIIIIVLMTAWASRAQTVTFASQEVAATVKEHIGLDDDAVVTQAQTDTITWLSLSGLGIRDISDIAAMPALEWLDLSGNAVADLSPLLSLEHLHTLNLSNNGLEDINPLAFASSKAMEVNVALNHIGDFSYFFRPMDSQFTIIGMDAQLAPQDNSFRICQLYATLNEKKYPVVVYRGYTNMPDNATLIFGETSAKATIDGETYQVEFPSAGQTVQMVRLTNGTFADTTYVVPYSFHPANVGETITIATGLPKHYRIASAGALYGTVTVEGTTLRYTASSELMPDVVAFSYYENSRLRGYGFLQTGLPMGDVNGDGKVDLSDVKCVVNHFVGIPNTSFLSVAADANGDGVVDIADAVHIVNFVVGKIAALAPR